MFNDKSIEYYGRIISLLMNNIVIFSQTLKENIQYLWQIFDIYKQNNISIKSFETFIGYLSVQLLGQKVDLLNLATIEEKLTAIAKLKFSNTFY